MAMGAERGTEWEPSNRRGMVRMVWMDGVDQVSEGRKIADLGVDTEGNLLVVAISAL